MAKKEKYDKSNARTSAKMSKAEKKQDGCRACAKVGGYCGKHAKFSKLHAKENYNISADDPDFLEKIANM